MKGRCATMFQHHFGKKDLKKKERIELKLKKKKKEKQQLVSAFGKKTVKQGSLGEV